MFAISEAVSSALPVMVGAGVTTQGHTKTGYTEPTEKNTIATKTGRGSHVGSHPSPMQLKQ